MNLNCVIEKWLACRCVHKHVFIFHNIINETDDINIMRGGGGGGYGTLIQWMFLKV